MAQQRRSGGYESSFTSFILEPLVGIIARHISGSEGSMPCTSAGVKSSARGGRLWGGGETVETDFLSCAERQHLIISSWHDTSPLLDPLYQPGRRRMQSRRLKKLETEHVVHKDPAVVTC